jgi:hypothetical protein
VASGSATHIFTDVGIEGAVRSRVQGRKSLFL